MAYPPVLLPFRLSRRSGLTRPSGDNTGARNVLYRTDMYLSKSNFIFPCSAPTNGQERAMKKHMLKYISLYK